MDDLDRFVDQLIAKQKELGIIEVDPDQDQTENLAAWIGDHVEAFTDVIARAGARHRRAGP
jgi:hypothetical protein